MGTQQHQIFAETISGIKRALKRKAYESDDDDRIDKPTNRGNKLQRNARYVRQGNISAPVAPEMHKEIIDHAGYQRAIINRNPLAVDEDGYGLDSDDDEEHIQAVTAATDAMNPYSSIRLEHILAPLTSTADLPSHPTMSRAYLSRTLTDLTIQGRDTMHKENESLYKIKDLLIQLCGDHHWTPCGLMEGENDVNLFLGSFLPPSMVPQETPSERTPTKAVVNGATKGDKPMGSVGKTKGTKQKPGKLAVGAGGNDTPMPDADKPNGENGDKMEGVESMKPPSKNQNKEDEPQPQPSEGDSQDPQDAKEEDAKEDSTSKGRSGKGKDKDKDKAPTEMDVDPPPSKINPKFNGGTTKTMTNGEAVPGPHPADDNAEAPAEKPFIHPLFLQPESARPDRNYLLPGDEAEELRKLLQLYVQRQEEICRGSRRLYEGLLKADRLRNMVYFWSKAEAHCGSSRDLSDGEDWYDKEEWGLEDSLKKGHDDEEEEAQSTQKKTRNRR